MSILLAPSAGRLNLIEPIGSGATSQVWRGTWVAELAAAPALPVAIKVARSPEQAPLLTAEAERLLWSQSFGTARLLAAGKVRVSSSVTDVPEESACLVLDWVGTTPLLSLPRPTADAGTSAALQLARDIGEALADLHQSGYAHGDVKPANIVIRDHVAADEVGRFVLVNLGLGDVAQSRFPHGATPRYLAPEALRSASQGDGRTRDMWALGVVLAETALGRAAANVEELIGACTQLSEPLRAIIQSCLTACPGTRASARWVASCANHALHQQVPAEIKVARRQSQLRRAYLTVRKSDILRAARSTRATVEITGLAHSWIETTLAQLRGWLELRGEKVLGDQVLLGDTTALERQRILTQVVGPTAAHWPMVDVVTEEDWLRRWLASCETAEPTSWTYASEQNESPPTSPPADGCDITELALALGSNRLTSAALEWAESIVLQDPVPMQFRIALAERLRARGQWGRALSVLAGAEDPLAQAEAAETARRAGDRAFARETLTTLLDHGNPAVRARACATYARLAIDSGELEAARTALANAPLTAAICESRALLALSNHNPDQAREAILLGNSLPASDEEHARLTGVLAMLEHNSRDAESSAHLFRRAVELATRAGAVLEEATYLTGLAHACVNCGSLGEAIAASERAIILFESLNRPHEAARAALNLVVCHAETGRLSETRTAFEFAIALARRAKDERCLGYLHLAMADVLTKDSAQALEMLQRAGHWLTALGPEEDMWVASRLYQHGTALSLETYDKQARQSGLSVEARLLWWGARARRATLDRALSDAPTILGELSALAALRAPLFTQARALSAGVELAVIAADGEIARRFTYGISDLARQALRNCPAELHPSLQALPWFAWARPTGEQSLSAEQITDIENLVRSLGRRDELRALLAQIVDALVLWTGVERGLLLLRAPGGRLQPRVGRNLKRTDLCGEQLELSHSLAERALSLGEPIVAVDATHDLEIAE